jgi:predicted Fe-S protein YdhL (DUF1289 family)
MSTCRHVYEIVHEDICSMCGRDTHEINWVQELKHRRAYAEQVGLDYKKTGWTSI